MANDKDWLLKDIYSERLTRLVWKVWCALPARDRRTLRGILEVVETNTIPSDWWGGCICYESPDEHGKFINKVGLSPDLNMPDVSDVHVCHTIAHELAHAILQHPRMMRVIKDLNEYDIDREAIMRLFEDQANLQVHDWGLANEFKGMRKTNPEGIPRWYVHIAMSYEDLLNELRSN